MTSVNSLFSKLQESAFSSQNRTRLFLEKCEERERLQLIDKTEID